jgi:CRP-like cAMP-binding protein
METQQTKKREPYRYSFFKAGTRLFNQGETGKDIYILKNGAVTVIVDNQIVGLINTPNTIIGEMAYFLGFKRTASIEAIEDSDCMIISGEYLNETVLKNPKIGLELLKILAERLAKTTKYASKLESDIEKYRNAIRKIKGLKEEKRATFAQELVYEGILTNEQFTECIKEMERRKKGGETISLPKILIEKKYISAEQLIQFLEMKQKK